MYKDRLPSIALIGAPCAAKTTIKNRVRKLARTKESFKVATLDEAWEPFDKFANLLFRFLEQGNGLITPQMVPAIIESMKQETALAFTMNEPLPDLEDRAIKKVSPDGKIYYEIHVDLWDQYWFYHLGFLEELENDDFDMPGLRQLMQRALIRIQAMNEVKALSDARKAMITDGSLLSIAAYLPEMEWTDFRSAMEVFGRLWVQDMAELGNVYGTIILLETLASLDEEEYQQHYFDGRRLDPPESARTFHARLLELTENHNNLVVIPAALPLETKFLMVLEIIQEVLDN